MLLAAAARSHVPTSPPLEAAAKQASATACRVARAMLTSADATVRPKIRSRLQVGTQEICVRMKEVLLRRWLLQRY
jgi:hypothetical protein